MAGSMPLDQRAASSTSTETASCCIVGGGPAGIMLGFLLARRGVDVLILEKHKDFFRDFRGDTIHPSTLQVIKELGLLEELLRQPHQEVRQIGAHFGNREVHIADFSRLPTDCKFIAFMPQWDFLNFVSSHARRFPNFRLKMEANVTDLLIENDRVVGVSAETPAGTLHVRAGLVVAADGRNSTIRSRAGFEVIDSGAPIDVLWFRLAKQADDPPQAFGFAAPGAFLVMINRGDYWQIAYVIRKGGFDEIQARGLEAFASDLARCAPFLADRGRAIQSWDEVKLLSVRVDHLRHWYRDGLLCIGDCAHAMSPIGGVGINLAIQDAVAAARLLAPGLVRNDVRVRDLKAVQHRRERPARMTQRAQIFLHEHLIGPILSAKQSVDPPLLMKLVERFPKLRGLPARMVGMGFRPEHVDEE